MAREHIYLLFALLIFGVASWGIGPDTKDAIFIVSTIILWGAVGMFWLWVYLQAQSRKLLVSKVVTLLIIIAAAALARNLLRLGGINSTLTNDAITLIIAGIVAIETYDLWRQSGRNIKRLEHARKPNGSKKLV